MDDLYSPHTGEHINTDSPADWMLHAGTPAPEYDAKTQGCFWRGEAWEVVDVTPSRIVPPRCTPAQGLVALFAIKQITEDDLLAAIAQIPDPVQEYTARIGLQRATSWERVSPTMQSVAALLNLSDEDLDDLFEYAAEVQV